MTNIDRNNLIELGENIVGKTYRINRDRQRNREMMFALTLLTIGAIVFTWFLSSHLVRLIGCVVLGLYASILIPYTQFNKTLGGNYSKQKKCVR